MHPNTSVERMKKLLFSLLPSLFLFISPLAADYKFEIRTAAFVPSEKHYRQVYGQLNSSYQAEASLSNDNIVDSFINFDWHSKQGKSSDCGQASRINVATGTIGVKFRYHLSELLTPYLGAGLSLAGVNTHKRTCHAGTTKHSRIATGYLFKSGIYMPLAPNYFIDIFVDYLHLPVNFHHRINVGGLSVGCGIGVNW